MSSDAERQPGDGSAETPLAPNPAHDLHLAIEQAQHTAPEPTWLPLKVLEFLGGLVVLALMLGVTTAVVLRIFGHGLTGVVELGALSMLFVVLLGAPALAARDEHVRLELVDFFTGPKVLRVLQHFGSMVQLVVTGLLIAAMWQVLQADLRRGTTIGGDLRIERWLISGFAITGLVALALGILVQWWRMIRRNRKA
ncbi:TRAP transporter small permease [Naumannella sp. ID2617S]|nr:TRAP transporter small permease [Naumannella sp. ID2617S]